MSGRARRGASAGTFGAHRVKLSHQIALQHIKDVGTERNGTERNGELNGTVRKREELTARRGVSRRGVEHTPSAKRREEKERRVHYKH